MENELSITEPELMPELERTLDSEPVLKLPLISLEATMEEQPHQPVKPELDPKLLEALGESLCDTSEFNTKIHDSLGKLWLPVLTKAIPKDKESFKGVYNF